jgi:hypothetical protein
MYALQSAVAAAPNLGDELIKLAFGGILAFLVAWFVAAPIAYGWDDLRRRRESDLAARNEFYRVYAKFFTTWKLWNTFKNRSSASIVTSTPEHVQWTLLVQAESAEAGFEGLH